MYLAASWDSFSLKKTLTAYVPGLPLPETHRQHKEMHDTCGRGSPLPEIHHCYKTLQYVVRFLYENIEDVFASFTSARDSPPAQKNARRVWSQFTSSRDAPLLQDTA
eukprot:10136855-Karenia_brevis.AAC.1